MIKALLRGPLWLAVGALLRRALIVFGVEAGWLPAVAVVATPVVVFLFFVAYARWIFWRCPACARLFHASWIRGDPFGDRCVHCGFTVSAPTPLP